jgi:NADH-quinone oxidoreductase subunit E
VSGSYGPIECEQPGNGPGVIARYPKPRSALVPLCHLAQEQDGYLTQDAMAHIAELIGCTSAEVYGTASFYEMFKLHPCGKYLVGVCTNISCMLDGAYELLEHAEKTLGVEVGGTTADGMFTLEEVECSAACTVAPAVQVNYRYQEKVTPQSFDALVADIRSGKRDDIPAHGTLAKARQVPSDNWAGTGTGGDNA